MHGLSRVYVSRVVDRLTYYESEQRGREDSSFPLTQHSITPSTKYMRSHNPTFTPTFKWDVSIHFHKWESSFILIQVHLLRGFPSQNQDFRNSSDVPSSLQHTRMYASSALTSCTLQDPIPWPTYPNHRSNLVNVYGGTSELMKIFE